MTTTPSSRRLVAPVDSPFSKIMHHLCFHPQCPRKRWQSNPAVVQQSNAERAATRQSKGAATSPLAEITVEPRGCAAVERKARGYTTVEGRGHPVPVRGRQTVEWPKPRGLQAVEDKHPAPETKQSNAEARGPPLAAHQSSSALSPGSGASSICPAASSSSMSPG